MITSLLWLIVWLIVLSLVYWGVQRLRLPESARIGAYVVLAIVAVVLVGQFLIRLLGTL